jgi:hypothetical protein
MNTILLSTQIAAPIIFRPAYRFLTQKEADKLKKEGYHPCPSGNGHTYYIWKY